MIEFEIQIVTPPAAPLVGIEEAKHKLYPEGEISPADDGWINTLCAAAEARLEADTGRVFAPRELRVSTYRPYGLFWQIPVSPVHSVKAVSFVDPQGEEREWPATEWKMDSQFDLPRLRPSAGKAWPSVICCTPDAWKMDVVAGYADDEDKTYLTAKVAALMLVEYWYYAGIKEVDSTTLVPLSYETIAWNLMVAKD